MHETYGTSLYTCPQGASTLVQHITEAINTSNMNNIHWQEIDKLQGVQLVDVRTRLEYLMGHIPGSINIPVSELEQHIGQLDLGHPIVVYCAVGMRGANACQILEQLGAIDVRNLVGGYKLWSSTRQG